MRGGEDGRRSDASSGARGIREGRSHWAGEPLGVWERRWDVPLLEAHDRIGSTNERLRELAREGARPFSVVVAEEQTAGRGRSGRTWHSPPGRGLWISVLLPAEPSGGPPLAPLLVGLAVVRAVRGVAPGVDPLLKWPNDVLVGGSKVCGILCEGGTAEGTVAGIGVNVRGRRDDFPAELRERVTTLEQEAGAEVRRPELAGRLLEAMRTLLDPVPDAIAGSLARELEAVDGLRGRPIRTETGLRGRGAGIAADGALLVRTEEGARHRVVAGSVERMEPDQGGRGPGRAPPTE